MNELFGIQMASLATALVLLLTLCLLSVAWIGWRRPVILKMGLRNIPRRRAQTGLIVAGLMLSTLIITSALGTGDTVDASMTKEVYDQLGQVDALVVDAGRTGNSGSGLDYTIPAGTLDLVDSTTAGNGDVDGVMPLLSRHVSAMNNETGLAEPDLMAVGIELDRVRQFGGLESVNGGQIDLEAMPANSVVLDESAADLLQADAGDRVDLFFDGQPVEMNVYAVAEDTLFSGGFDLADQSGDLAGLMMRLDELQQLSGLSDSLSVIALSYSSDGGTESADNAVRDLLQPVLSGASVEFDPVKTETLDDARMIGQLFTGLFLVVGLFSIAAGILLILVIFTMLAAERRAEMGMSRAVGAQRSQLVQQFVSEGAAYALLAGLVGSALGVLSALGIGYGLNAVFGDFIQVDPTISVRSMVVAYCLGVVITFAAVAGSSWKISRLNVVSAIRDLPEPSRHRSSWRALFWPVLMLAAGALMTVSGIDSGTALPFMGGVSLLILASALLLRAVGLPSRLVFTVAGLLTLLFWLLPQKQFERIFGTYEGDFEMFFLSGLFLVISSTLVLVQNDRVLLGVVSRMSSVFRSKLASFRLGVAYPGAARSRTGMTIAMFSLIVFSLVTMATINLNLSNALLSDEASAGWDVRADVVGPPPIDDLRSQLEKAGVDTSQFAAVGALTSPSTGEVGMRSEGDNAWSDGFVTGMDAAFIESTEWKFSRRATGYESDQAIVDALLGGANVAVVDPGMIESDGDMGNDGNEIVLDIDLDQMSFEPLTLELRGEDGRPAPVTVIGVIDPTLSSLFGLFTNQGNTEAIYGEPALTSYRIQLADAGQSEAVARQVESALLPFGVQGISIQDQIEEDQQENEGFFLILQAFMALGMLVGVAAIGVIASRNVVERRQQIGVMRALGFQRGHVSLSFLIEAAFIVGLGVVSGTLLGLTLARNLVTSGEIEQVGDIAFAVPWNTVGIILALAVSAAMVMTWFPARQASRIAPAEALRYE